MRRQKPQLTARMILEAGKPWAQADADVAEAIDFCRYYARTMIQMSEKPWHGAPPHTTATLRWPSPAAARITLPVSPTTDCGSTAQCGKLKRWTRA